jgi:peptide chain release factor subunit 1
MSLSFLRDYTQPQGTSMVSLLLPPGTSLDKIRTRMTGEISTSQNIKDKSNRLSVGVALSRISEYLKGLRQIPKTGLALYSEQYI